MADMIDILSKEPTYEVLINNNQRFAGWVKNVLCKVCPDAEIYNRLHKRIIERKDDVDGERSDMDIIRDAIVEQIDVNTIEAGTPVWITAKAMEIIANRAVQGIGGKNNRGLRQRLVGGGIKLGFIPELGDSVKKFPSTKKGDVNPTRGWTWNWSSYEKRKAEKLPPERVYILKANIEGQVECAWC